MKTGLLTLLLTALLLASIPAYAFTTDGICGGSNGGMFTVAPSVNLCSAGDPTVAIIDVTTGRNWIWSCNSPDVGLSATCGAVAGASLGGTAADGNLRVTQFVDGSMNIERYVAADSNWYSQVYGGVDKGSQLQTFNGLTYDKFFLGYYTGDYAFRYPTTTMSLNGSTLTSTFSFGPTAAVTNGTTGPPPTPDLVVTQETTYEDGTNFILYKWNFQNPGATAIDDLRFFHGEDTFFLGSDNGGGFWDPATQTVGVERLDATGSSFFQRMSLQASDLHRVGNSRSSGLHS